MKLRNCNFNTFAAGLGIAATLGLTLSTYGGWTGAMNGTAYGWAGVSVTSSKGFGGAARTATLTRPSAAMSPTTGYIANAPLPSGSSLNTVARIKGAPGYIWQAQTTGSNGDKTDNQEIAKRVVIKPAECTSLIMESLPGAFDGQTGLGQLVVKTTGTAGTALLLRGFEVGDVNTLPPDDPNTPEDETLDFVKANGALKFENLVIGPFEYGYNGKCELVIHYALEGRDLNNFIVTTDGTAQSIPMSVTCPPTQTIECGDNYVYPPVEVNSCRAVTVYYSPDESELEPGQNTVTVTAVDELGDTATCSFVVNVVDSKAPVAPVLADVVRTCGSAVTLTPPTTSDACSGTITGTTTTVFPITQPGTTTVTWTFTDGQGRSSTATQKVTIGGYTFVGFYSPIGTSGGTCTAVAKEIKAGSATPIKFDYKCGSSVITTGVKPIVKIQQWSNSCNLLSEPVSISAEYQNDWHINWDSTGWAKGLYKIIAVLPDGTSQHVFVRLK